MNWDFFQTSISLNELDEDFLLYDLAPTEFDEVFLQHIVSLTKFDEVFLQHIVQGRVQFLSHVFNEQRSAQWQGVF